MYRILLLVISLLFLTACGQSSGSDALDSPALPTTSLHDDGVARVSSQSINVETMQGLWEADPKEEEGTKYIDRVRISKNVTMFSRKCTFEDGTVLVAEDVVLSHISAGKLVLDEQIAINVELGDWACNVKRVKKAYDFVADAAKGIATVLASNFRKISQ